jgi:hypothetical protein
VAETAADSVADVPVVVVAVAVPVVGDATTTKGMLVSLGNRAGRLNVIS